MMPRDTDTPLPDVRNDATNSLADLAEVRAWALEYIANHPTPDFHVGPDDDHQLQRWFIVPRNPFHNVYLHRFLRSDDDRACHNHPWENTSLVLSGEYREMFSDGSSVIRHEGEIIPRAATVFHRVELVSGPVVTLFFTGPIIQGWGFLCGDRFVRWRDFVTVTDGGNSKGKGCGE
jgi:hypothetical protein